MPRLLYTGKAKGVGDAFGEAAGGEVREASPAGGEGEDASGVYRTVLTDPCLITGHGESCAVLPSFHKDGRGRVGQRGAARAGLG